MSNIRIKKLLKLVEKDIFSFGESSSIEDLEYLLEQASDAYYNTAHPILIDQHFDILIDFIRKRKPKSNILKQVGAPVKNKVSLDYYLGSMDKIKMNSTKLDNWKKKYSGPYYLSDKLDGISGLVVYNNNQIKLFTRGTATEGMDITDLIKYLNLPSFIVIKKQLEKLNIKGKKNLIALRGEIIMSKNNFKKYSKEFKNARNLVAGLVNSKYKKPLILKDLDFVLYQVVDPNISFSKQMELIKALKLDRVYFQKEKNLSYEILSDVLKQQKKDSLYEVDGIIVINDEIHKLAINKNPEYAFAFKEMMEETFKETSIIDIEWNISKSGKIIPTVLIKPVDIEGVTISRVTAFNAKFVKDNGLGKNAKIQITRSGDVIPYIVKIIKKVNPKFPDIKYKWSKSGIDIITTKISNEQHIRENYFFFKTLNTRGFGMKLIIKLYENGYTTIEQILNLTVDNLLELDNIKDKSANNFYQELQRIKQKTFPIEILILATNSLGENFGSRKAKLILNEYPDILNKKINISNKSKMEWLDKLIKINGIEKKIANQIIDNWDNLQNNLKWLKKYFKIEFKQKSISIKSKLKYINWVLTGFRDKLLQEKIENMGGKISNTISKNTDILVIKDNSVLDNPTSKILKAQELGIKIIEKSQIKNFI